MKYLFKPRERQRLGPQVTSAQCFFVCFMHYAEAKYCDNVFCGFLLQSAGNVLCYLEVFVLISLDYLGLCCWVWGTLSPE